MCDARGGIIKKNQRFVGLSPDKANQ